MNENVKKKHLALAEKIEKGQEIINKNLWIIYGEIEKFDLEIQKKKHGIIFIEKKKIPRNEIVEKVIILQKFYVI